MRAFRRPSRSANGLKRHEALFARKFICVKNVTLKNMDCTFLRVKMRENMAFHYRGDWIHGHQHYFGKIERRPDFIFFQQICNNHIKCPYLLSLICRILKIKRNIYFYWQYKNAKRKYKMVKKWKELWTPKELLVIALFNLKQWFNWFQI